MSILLHPHTAVDVSSVERTPHGSIIFHGSAGLGKGIAARELAARLNCLDGKLGTCANCRQIAAGNYPDFIWLDQAEKSSIGIEAVRTIIAELALRPYSDTGTRVVVIDNAHLLTLEAQNALLKLLEEPPPSTLLILCANYLEALIVTVRSRCRAVRFMTPDVTQLAKWLTDNRGVPGPAAQELAEVSNGSPGIAVTLVDNPAQADALATLTQSAGAVGSKRLFDRLILGAKLAAMGEDLGRFAEALHRRLVTETANGEQDPVEMNQQLQAIERFRQHLNAKVNGRAAIERLMLELGR